MASQTTSLQNHFLIAMPALNDSYFHQSVIYLCDHSEDGAMGLIINQPSEMTLNELLAHLKLPFDPDAKHNPRVFIGGPVAKNQGLLLHTNSLHDDESIPIGENVFLSTSLDALATLAQDNSEQDALVSLGYAGWQAGQLEHEIANNDWLTVQADHDILFNTSRQDCWQQAAQLLGINIHLMPDITGHA